MARGVRYVQYVRYVRYVTYGAYVTYGDMHICTSPCPCSKFCVLSKDRRVKGGGGLKNSGAVKIGAQLFVCVCVCVREILYEPLNYERRRGGADQ